MDTQHQNWVPEKNLSIEVNNESSYVSKMTINQGISPLIFKASLCSTCILIQSNDNFHLKK